MTPAHNLKPDNILHEIAELWSSMTKPQPGDAPEEYSPGSLRACAMTLIIFINGEEDPRVLDATLEAVMRAHPNRAVIVRLEEDGATLESRVSARCWMPVGHHREVCCEEIELTASISRLLDVPGIVSPLAAPDVPRVVWFRSPRLETAPDVSGLLTLADKIIVDSEHPGAPTFADLRVLSQAGNIVADLAWTRLTKVRELLAQLVGNGDADRIHQATIDYAGAEPSPGARYLQAWLRCEIPGIDVDLHRIDSAGRGEIKAIRITPDISIQIKPNCAEFETGSLRQRANLPGCADYELLNEELNIMTHDPVYERALTRMSVWIPRS